MARTKGAKNKHSFNAELLAQKFDLQPLEILLMIAHGQWEELGCATSYDISLPDRLRAAEKACAYLYSQKQAVQVAGELGLKIIVEDYTKKDE